MDTDITTTLRDFILSAYLFGDESRMPTDDASLLDTGILDSTGVLELIEFLESTFNIQVGDAETIPENLGSISGLTRFVIGKTQAHAGSPAP